MEKTIIWLATNLTSRSWTEKIKGKVKFGDDLYINIEGKGLILFLGKTGEQKPVTNI